MLSQQLEVDAEGVLAGPTVLAGQITYTGIDDDSIADLKSVVRDSAQIADRVYYSGGVTAKNPGRRDLDPWKPGDHEQIQMIECRSFDADANLSALGLRLRQIGAVLDLVEPAVRRDGESSHAIMGALYSVGTLNYGCDNCGRLEWLRPQPEDTDFDFHPLPINLNAPHKGTPAW